MRAAEIEQADLKKKKIPSNRFYDRGGQSEPWRAGVAVFGMAFWHDVLKTCTHTSLHGSFIDLFMLNNCFIVGRIMVDLEPIMAKQDQSKTKQWNKSETKCPWIHPQGQCRVQILVHFWEVEENQIIHLRTIQTILGLSLGLNWTQWSSKTVAEPA